MEDTAREDRACVARVRVVVSAAILKTPPIKPILRSLRAVRRRLVAQAFLHRLANLALISGAVLVVFGAWRRWVLGGEPWDAEAALLLAIAAPAASLLWTMAHVPGLTGVAEWLDAAAGTRDRFSTALSLSKTDAAPEMHVLAVVECTSFIARTDFRSRARLRAPRQLRFLAVPIAALAMLQWEARLTFDRERADETAARNEAEDTARKLEELARKAKKAGDDAKSEELKNLAEELQRRADQLRADAKQPDAAEKAALREISALEQLVREMQKQPAASTELQELAKALDQKDATKAAADALKGGDLAKAAEELEKSLRELAARKDERTPDEVKQALANALQHLAAKQKLSEQMQRLAQQMQQGGQGSQTMQQLAQLLRQMQQGQQPRPGQGAGQPLSEQALQQLLAALQNMKDGQDGKDGGGKDRDGKPGGIVAMESFGQPNPGETPAADPRIPGGQPGSEHDEGTTATPFGEQRNDAGRDAKSQQLGGRLGDGETLRQFLPTAADGSHSSRRYRELYEAMAPAAEEAVLQESIPLGSRFFIKRYFESIRPRE